MTETGFLLAEVAAGGLLLDLESGGIFQLNGPAALIWRWRLDGRSDTDIARAFARQFLLDEHQARRDTLAALSLPVETLPSSPEDEFQYRRQPDGYVFHERGVPMLAVDLAGERLRNLAVDPPASKLRALLLGVAPKLISLRGHAALHASAVALRRGVLAFSGPSGAGKTTTARALAQQGARIVCEDKLILRMEGDRVNAVLHGEAVVAAWSGRTAETLRNDGSASCDGLDEALHGDALPLRELGFIEARRRQPLLLEARLMPGCDAAAAVFRNAFHGSGGSLAWKRELNHARLVANQTAAFEVNMPDDLSSLATAAGQIVRRGSLKA